MNTETKSAINAAKRGFTLVELLVVVAILGVLGTIAVQNVTEHLKTANITAAQSSVTSIKEAVVSYQIKHKKLPSKLSDLTEGTDENPPILDGGEAVLIDPWDNEYKYEKSKQRFYIVSAGPDGEFGNDDDIRSDKLQKNKKGQ